MPLWKTIFGSFLAGGSLAPLSLCTVELTAFTKHSGLIKKTTKKEKVNGKNRACYEKRKK